MKIRRDCPLNKECESVDKETEEFIVCKWLMDVEDKNAIDGSKNKGKECAIPLIPITHVALMREITALHEAIVSLKNETVKRQDEFLGLVHSAKRLNDESK